MNSEPITTLELDDDRHLRQQRWEWYAEHCGMTLMAVTLVAALLGLLGPGPLSRQEAVSPDGKLRVEYDNLQRYGATTEWKLRFPASNKGSVIQMGLTDELASKITIESLVPPPESSERQGRRVVYSFRMTDLPREGVIFMRTRNETFGSLRGEIDIAGSSVIPLSIFVFP